MNLQPKYRQRLKKYLGTGPIIIPRADIDKELGNLLLLTRMRKQTKAKTLAELLDQIQ